MSLAQGRFVQLALSKLGSTVLWAQRGPDVFDCSGLVAWALHGVGGRDLRPSHNAQMMADETPDLITAAPAEPLPGDLCFYGVDAGHIIHVAIWLSGGRCLSADGATKSITTLQAALLKPVCRVHLHEQARFRKDLPFFAVHRNTYVDDVDFVSR